MVQLDGTDHAILKLLQEDDRRTYSQIGMQVGLSAATVHDRVRKLERRGALLRYRALVAPEAIGLHVTAFVFLNLQGGSSCQEIASTIESISEVEECHSVAGDADLLLKVRAPSTPALEELLLRLRRVPGVARTHSHVVLATRFEDRARLAPSHAVAST